MESPRHLISQAAAQHGVSPNSAKRALYLQGLSHQSRTVSYAAKALGVAESTVKLIARRFMIDLADYRPYSSLERRGLPRPAPKIRDINQAPGGMFSA